MDTHEGGPKDGREDRGGTLWRKAGKSLGYNLQSLLLFLNKETYYTSEQNSSLFVA